MRLNRTDAGSLAAIVCATLVAVGVTGLVADGDRFDAIYGSTETEEKLAVAQALPRHWGVRGTPSVIVNGRYLLSGRTAGGYPKMVAVGQRLILMEHAAFTS